MKMYKWVKCSCCGKPIKVGSDGVFHNNYAGVFCSTACCAFLFLNTRLSEVSEEEIDNNFLTVYKSKKEASNA